MCSIFKKNILKIRGVQPPPLILVPEIQGGGLRPPQPLLLWRPCLIHTCIRLISIAKENCLNHRIMRYKLAHSGHVYNSYIILIIFFFYDISLIVI